jgi:hypothetical protein
MPAIEWPRGYPLGAADDELRVRLCRECVDREHPETQHADAPIRERVAADTHDAQPVA